MFLTLGIYPKRACFGGVETTHGFIVTTDPTEILPTIIGEHSSFEIFVEFSHIK
jgi:hypothetical protein